MTPLRNMKQATRGVVGRTIGNLSFLSRLPGGWNPAGHSRHEPSRHNTPSSRAGQHDARQRAIEEARALVDRYVHTGRDSYLRQASDLMEEARAMVDTTQHTVTDQERHHV